MDYTIIPPSQRSTSPTAKIRNQDAAHSGVLGVLLLITIVMIMGGAVMLIVTSQPQPEKVPMAYLGIAKSSDGVDLVNKPGDTLTNSSVTIIVDGIDRTPEFEAQENVPGWGTLKPGDRLHFTSPVKPEVVQIIYSGSAGQYLLASTQPVTNTPVQGGNPIKISAQQVAATQKGLLRAIMFSPRIGIVTHGDQGRVHWR